MENSDVEDRLDEAKARFERTADTVEDGLDVENPALLQLRKACRLVDAAQFLREEDRHYTVVVEASFAAIERTIQFYLLDAGLLHVEEYVNHERVYEMGADVGLYDDVFADKLTGLWRNNRSDTYYREGVATEQRAETMLALAEAVHEHTIHLAGESHKCICNHT